MNPEKLDKYLYIKKTPTWWVRTVYFLNILACVLLLYSILNTATYSLLYVCLVGPFILLFFLFYFLSNGLNLFYKQFDLKKHQELSNKYRHKNVKSYVDVFLPICGEDFALIKNTWDYVSKLNYKNIKVYVLDDSKTECAEHKNLAETYGFKYLERSDKGKLKKAGNLKYGLEHSNGDFIVVFDADFAPRSDFIYELLPYMDDTKVAIIQSPQYFETTKDTHNKSALEYGASQVQEPFYRIIQVVRDRLGGAVCCGSNAIYRRSALEAMGGFVQVEHSEDISTGFAAAANGYSVLYIPIILAIGICPSDMFSYFHQQHRWGSGNINLILSSDFWKSNVSWKIKICYFGGFLFYLVQPFLILLSFLPLWTLFLCGNSITFTGSLLFYPATIMGIFILFFFPIARIRYGSFLALLSQTYSYSHAIFSGFLKSTVFWIPTNVKHTSVSTPFKQATLALHIYTMLYLFLTALEILRGDIHLFNYNYFVVQCWIFYNLFFSIMLLWNLYITTRDINKREINNETLSFGTLLKQKIKTFGSHAVSLFSVLVAYFF